jgi:2-polyprenyl-6-methoxyphenol hydroxylase-like FAD-dependent oxidoreductase
MKDRQARHRRQEAVMTRKYDAIIVGARCGGSPTAMLLARKGYRVLLLDRAAFPSDTLSTHVIQPRGVAALSRWGLLDHVIATGCPPVDVHHFDFGPVTVSGTPRPHEGNSTVYAPRRTVLDKLLVDAAVSAGVELRENFTVDELLVEDGCVVGVAGHGRDGRRVSERAHVVVGADGRNSTVAKTMRPAAYHTKPRLQHSYFTYWENLPIDGFEIVIRPDRGWGAIETNDGLTMLVVGWPIAERDDYRSDIEGNYLKTLEMAPDFAERVRAAKRAAPFTGGSVHNFFRVPFGPGWALVGDAGYNKDPITAQGISDAFRDAELCAAAIEESLSGQKDYTEAMAIYHRTRDAEVLPMYEFTTQLATLEPPPPEVQQVLGAVTGDQTLMNDFVGVSAGTVSPAEFFAPDNISRIFATGGSSRSAAEPASVGR